ncbi:MAG: hypothetical protein IJ370_00730 [Oscillospiraceae bacterium]|nr:hypothetical protein [Oscillospiraceae bacterium]
MEEFFWNLGDAIEDFFATDAAAIIGAGFVVATVILVLLLLRYFEKK